GVDLIRRAKHDVNPAAVGLPPRDAGGEVLVGISDAPVVLFFKLVLVGVGRGIAALPEGLDELVALLVVRKLHEGGSFFVRDNPAYVLVQPLPIGLAQLNLECLGVGFPLLFRDRALEWIYRGSLGRRSVVTVNVIVIGALRILVLRLGKGGKTQCHCHCARQHTNRTKISKAYGEHKGAYLTRDFCSLILCSLDTTRQGEVACREKIF